MKSCMSKPKCVSYRWPVLSMTLAAGLSILPNAHAQGKASNTSDVAYEASILDLQAELTEGTLTSHKLVKDYLARITAYNQNGPALNAIVTLNPDALAQADRLDRERKKGGPHGPLYGIPILVKDNYDTIDMPTSGGTLALARLQPTADAFQVKRLRDAGAIILGKATMHELAAGITTVSSLTGYTRNPYDPSRAPGGSSGGPAVSVAASFAAAAMGSDTCGSIRIPAAFQNLVGLRTTRGLASRTGVMPLSSTQDIAAPLARTVTDLAIMLDATVGTDPEDPTTADANQHVPKSYLTGLKPDSLKGARIGVVRSLFGNAPEDAEVTTVIDKALSTMKAQGADIVEITLPELDGEMRDSSIIPYEFKYDLAAYLNSHPGAPVHSLGEILDLGMDHEQLDAGLRLRNGVDLQTKKDSDALAQVLQKRAALKSMVSDKLVREHLDALVYPTMLRKPALIGEPQGGWQNCQLSASTGLPALALPAGWTPDGLPVGLELLGAEFAEPTLLNLAYGWEQSTSPRRAPFTTPPLIDGKAPRPETLATVHLGQDGTAADIKFSYNAITGRLTYHARTHAIGAARVIGMTLQHGTPDKPGPVIWNLLRQGQTVANASIVLRGADRQDLVSGKLFVQLYTTDAPLGMGRRAVRMPTEGLLSRGGN